MKYGDYLAHFNPNHDPRNGQFTSNDQTDDSRSKIDVKKAMLIGGVAISSALLIYGGIYVAGSKMSYPKPPISSMVFGSKIDLDKLSDNDVIVPKNKKITRLSTKSIEDYVHEGKQACNHVYAAIGKKDAALYKTALPKMSRPGIPRNSEYYVHDFSLKKEIKVMSRKKAAEAFIELFGIDDAGRYGQFTTNLITRTNPDVQRYVEYIKSKGYDAIIDENDVGWAKNPILLLDPKSVIESTKIHKLGKHEKAISAWIANFF